MRTARKVWRVLSIINLREGLWKIYYESGDLKESGSYVDDKRTGACGEHFFRMVCFAVR
jgi:antitoxin component YwqK of YwqJK toxin-antitoxin module